FEAILRIYYGSSVRVITSGQHDLDGGGFGDVGVFVDRDGAGTTEALILHSNGRTLATRSDQVLGLTLLDAVGWVTADLTGDGREDLAVLIDSARGPQLRVLTATGRGFSPAQVWWDSAVEGPSLSASRVRLVSADWDADGRADLGLVVAPPAGHGTIRLYGLISSGDGLAAPELAWQGATEAAPLGAYGGDFNGDGRGDLALVEDRGAV